MAAALVFLLLALWPQLIFTYNVDTAYPIVFEDPELNASSNNFGYTVVLSTIKGSPPELNLFVGAPKSNKGEGKVYRCTENRNGGNLRRSCRGLVIAENSALKDIVLANKLFTLIMGNSTGLGASMAMRESSDLTVCAPYSIINSRRNNEKFASQLEDMRGYCYTVPNALGNVMYRDNEPLARQFRYPTNKLINTLYGFSVDYAVKKGNSTMNRIIGQPRLNKVDIKEGNRQKLMNYALNEFDNLGYSVSSGYYFDSTKLVYVAGAPRWMRTGKIVYIELHQNGDVRETPFEGTTLGEYFGASLATGDFDNDGLDDLAVGAPHWGQVDFGRVYILFGNKYTFVRGPILQGSVEYGQFGYTLASGNLDSDEYSDLVVSAPWEESGVVYIYYGSSDFKTKDPSMRTVQRIAPSEMVPPLQVSRFGFSLSQPVDFDDNGYPDLAIGAYKSNHAVVLRGRPIIHTSLDLISYPPTLSNTTESFVVAVCVSYHGLKAPDTQEFEFKMTMDEDHKRVEDGTVKYFSDKFTRNAKDCKNQTIKLTQGNFLDPILISATLWIKEKAGGEFCPSCPVLDRKTFGKSKTLKVPFNTGCKSEICHSKLSVAVDLGGNGKFHEWVVGSGDLKLKIDVKNEEEPAHQTQLTIDIPALIRLRSVISFCTEKRDESDKAVTLVCEIDKPIGTGETISLEILLDMGQVLVPVGGTELIFNVTKRTRSVDHGTGPNPTMAFLKVNNVAFVTLTGVADSENLDYRRTENKSMVRIRHTYQVVKKGETPILAAELTIDVPVAKSGMNNTTTFLMINDTKFTDSLGQVYKCTIDSYGHDVGDSSAWTSPTGSGVVQARRRRDASNDDQTESMEVDESEGAIITQTTDKTIYLNCSSNDFECVKVKCLFGLIKNSDDVGSMVLDIDFDASSFYTSNEDSLTLRFNTNASVKIILPKALDPTFLRNTTADVSTMIYNIPEPQKLAGWIVPVSVILGILLLCILVFVLFRFGFFKRSQKLETAKARERELILNTGGNTDDDEDADRFG